MAGPWDKYGGGASGGGVYTIPDPEAERRARQDAERLQMAREAAARAAAAEKRAAGEVNRPPSGYRWGASGALEAIPGGPADPRTLQAATKPALTAKERADAIASYQSAAQLDRIVAQLEEQFAAGPGATSGIMGLQDYLPTTANQQFDRTGNAARGIVGTALGFTGGQLNTATEAEAAVGPYLPQSGDRDATIRDKIERLRALAGDARNRSVAILGGAPDANGQITPVQSRNAMEQTNLTQQGPGQAAGFGATSQSVPVNPEYQAEYTAYLEQNIGNLDPEDYVRKRLELDQKYGYGADPALAEQYRAWASDAAQKGRTGGTVPTTIPGVKQPLSGLDRIRNDLVSNPAGAAAAGFANMGGFGIPEALAPDQMGALGDANPVSMAIGQIGGSLAGTSALGKAAQFGLRNAPRLSALASKASPFARSLAADTAYSGIYGGVTDGDPLTSAALGALGSAGGQAVGMGLGSLVAGAKISPSALRLRSAGIPLTTGQQLGGIAKSVEDRLTSVPLAGDMVNARRQEGLRAFNQQALDEAGRPIGARVKKIGETGASSLFDQIGNAYDNATAGVNVPLDPQFAADVAAARGAGSRLPPDFRGRFDTALNNRLQPIENAGQLSGKDYQQAVRGFKGYRASAGQAAPGFEGDYKDALTAAQTALTDQMTRGGGQGVVDGLGRANAAYMRAKVVKKAMEAAKNGSGSGEVQVFTPAQLNTAATSAANKFGGKRPFSKLIDDGQTVLPSKIGDSGTAGRLAQMALPTTIGAGAATSAGYGVATDSPAAYTPAAVLALLAAGGTKTGQKALQKLLIDRPDNVRRVGRAVSKKKGLFGSATLPFFIE